MKFSGSLVAIAALAAIGLNAPVAPAQADEYFVPQGHVYTPDSYTLPRSHTRQAQIEKQTDVLETEIYRRKQADRVFFERFQNFNDLDLFYPSRSYSDY